MRHPQNPQLDFFASPEMPDVEWIEGELDRARCWLFAAELCRRAGIEDDEDHKRWIRQLACRSKWVVSGQRGYRHMRHATAEEIDHCCAGLESQARELVTRAIRLRRNAHQMVG